MRRRQSVAALFVIVMFALGGAIVLHWHLAATPRTPISTPPDDDRLASGVSAAIPRGKVDGDCASSPRSEQTTFKQALPLPVRSSTT